jgi:hypothetical protein
MKKTFFVEQLSREEYISKFPGSEIELSGQIYDLFHKMNSLKPGREKFETLNKIRKLINERDKLSPPFTCDPDYINIFSSNICHDE